MTDMRAKMKINHIDGRNGPHYETLYFNPVCANQYPADGMDEDNTFARFSPSGMIQLTIANPALIGKFQEGETYYVDFTKVPKAVPAMSPAVVEFLEQAAATQKAAA